MSDPLVKQSSLHDLIWLLCFKAFLLAAIILYAGIGLGPDEAQYWTWSQALDWGYYSKPPGIAWQIWLGTKLFGQTEFGVRSLSILISFLQSISLYFLALKCGLRSSLAFWCGVFLAFSPLGVLGSFLAITDGGFLLFWILASLYFVSSLAKQTEVNPLPLGLLIAGGALFKWPIYLFWIFFLICRSKYFSQQSFLKVGQGVLLSCLGLLPSLWWNRTHDWATFRHVGATLQGGSTASEQTGNLAEFIGSQAALISPILFILLIFACWRWVKHLHSLSPPLFFCGLVTISSLSLLIGASAIQKIQGNWGIFVYPTGLVLIVWAVGQQTKSMVWLKIGGFTALGFAILTFLLPSFSFVPHRMNPFKHNVGWTQLKDALASDGYDSTQHFLVSDKYQTTSLLSFYNEGQKRAYFLNVNQIRQNQFSYWPSLQEEEKGKTGFFVWVENAPYLKKERIAKQGFYEQELKKYFAEVELVGFSPLVYQKGEIAKGALIFKCGDCLDKQHSTTDLW